MACLLLGLKKWNVSHLRISPTNVIPIKMVWMIDEMKWIQASEAVKYSFPESAME